MTTVAMNCPPVPTPPPAAQKCLGPEFVIDGCGDMRVRGAGAVRWPFSQPMPANNGLNVDAARGIWTAPHGLYRLTYGPGLSTVPAGTFGQLSTDQAHPVATLGPGGTLWAPSSTLLPTVQFANPSACARMAVWWWMTSAVRLVTWPGTHVEHRACVEQSPIPARGVGSFLNPQNSPYSNRGWDDVRSVRSGYTSHGSTVAPGATVTLYPKIEVFVIGPSGSQQCLLMAWAVWITAIGVLMDPTQVGDPS